jgi:uncharacterized protein YutE (UPF0331/DUF86 family)
MTYLVERLVELRRHLDHLYKIRLQVIDADALEMNMSLRNDVLFSLLMVCQLVVDIAGELSARRGERFEDYTDAVRKLAGDPRFGSSMLADLERLPGFRNVVIHEYVALDLQRVAEALNRLEPVEQFVRVVSSIEREAS